LAFGGNDGSGGNFVEEYSSAPVQIKTVTTS